MFIDCIYNEVSRQHYGIEELLRHTANFPQNSTS